jgi:hypothetical protein
MIRWVGRSFGRCWGGGSWRGCGCRRRCVHRVFGFWCGGLGGVSGRWRLVDLGFLAAARQEREDQHGEEGGGCLHDGGGLLSSIQGSGWREWFGVSKSNGGVHALMRPLVQRHAEDAPPVLILWLRIGGTSAHCPVAGWWPPSGVPRLPRTRNQHAFSYGLRPRCSLMAAAGLDRRFVQLHSGHERR